MSNLNLKATPFNLTDADIAWVKTSLANMTQREKVGQLFCLLVASENVEAFINKLNALDMKPGGFMSRPFPGAVALKINRELQNHAKLPLLLAANLERGGNGVAMDGTHFGSQLQVAATDDETHAYRLGLVCGREGRAVGCNWGFSPVVDIDYNFMNPITNTRTYGSDPARVLRMARAYMRGLQESGLAVSIKHWPGDGVDGRDQHLLTSVNSLSVEDWDKTFGMVYGELIRAGADTVMSAHIQQPAYSRKLRPGIADADIMPASLAPELNIDLLRGKLGFNGLVVTDATSMAGFTMPMPREKAVPYSIAAGNDIFLFVHDLEEDFNFMLDGVRTGIITPERLDEAVTRILALKASLHLHDKMAAGTLIPNESELSVLACEEHTRWAKECADKSVTLVKNLENILPLSPQTHHRVLLYVLGDIGGYMNREGGGVGGAFANLLRAEGFEVDNFDYTPSKTATMGSHSYVPTPVNTLKQKYDVVVYLASIETASNQTIVRINWGQPMGFDAPKFINDIPTVFISVNNPYHLQDVSRVKTFINGYSASHFVIQAVVAKLVGKSAFTGVNPVDPFCGMWDARL